MRRPLSLLPSSAFLAALLAPASVSAAVFDGGGLLAGINIAGSIPNLIKGTIDQMLVSVMARISAALVVLGTFVIVVAGLYLILGFGDEGAKDKAKKMIMYTVVGMAVIILANTIVTFFVAIIMGDAGGIATVMVRVAQLLQLITGFVALASTVVIVTAGFYMILGFGDEGAKDRAKKMIIYTVVGMLIIMLSSTIVGLVLSLFGTAPAEAEAIREIVRNMLVTVTNFLGLAATIVVITAGIYLILGFGSEDSKERAKKMIFYTLIGLTIVLFARVIVGFVTTSFIFGG